MMIDVGIVEDDVEFRDLVHRYLTDDDRFHCEIASYKITIIFK